MHMHCLDCLRALPSLACSDACGCAVCMACFLNKLAWMQLPCGVLADSLMCLASMQYNPPQGEFIYANSMPTLSC